MPPTIQLPPESTLSGEFFAMRSGPSRPLARGEVALDEGERVFVTFRDIDLGPEALAALDPAIPLVSISFDRTRLRPDLLRAVAALPHLADLSFFQMEPTPADLAVIAAGSAPLARLTFHGLALADAHLEALAPSPTLTALSAYHYQPSAVTDAALEHAARLRSLTRLTLQTSEHLTGSGLAALAARGQLDYLELVRMPSLEERFLVALENLPTLSGIDLGSNKRLGDETCRILARLPRLEAVKLEGNTKLTDAGLLALGELPRLRWVALSKPARQRKVTTAAVEAFQKAHPGVQITRS
jgi:hypothetical protein